MGNVVSHALGLERGEDLLHKVAEGDVVAAHEVSSPVAYSSRRHRKEKPRGARAVPVERQVASPDYPSRDTLAKQ